MILTCGVEDVSDLDVVHRLTRAWEVTSFSIELNGADIRAMTVVR